jgi:predicted nucleotidyltransferase
MDQIAECVRRGVEQYNRTSAPERRIVRVELFGSYADGRATDTSDLDLLVEFATPNVGLFALASALMAMEDATGMAVDIVQLPLPDDTLLEIERSVPLYAAA